MSSELEHYKGIIKRLRKYLRNRIDQILSLFDTFRIKEESKTGIILASKIDAFHEILATLKSLEEEES